MRALLLAHISIKKGEKMSIGICGSIDYNSDEIEEEVDCAYFIMEQSIKWRLGCKLGGNISEHAYDIMEKNTSKSPIFMEIMDTPLDNYAQEMCQPSIDGDGDSEASIRQKLVSNFGDLQGFLKSIMKHEKVRGIVLYFNYEFWQEDDKVVEMQVDNFVDGMLENYKEKEYWAPVLKIVLMAR